jgi:ankyrin repeat protein
MNSYKQQFSDLSSEYLLQRRAMGSELADEAHTAIEEVFAERGEKLPPRPTIPISPPEEERSRYTLPVVVGFMLALIAAGVLKAVLHTSIGFIAVGIGLVVWEIISRSRTKPAEPSSEELRAQAEEEGLTEVMTCAAEGNTHRIKELLAYGHKVNAKSPSGTTALMYAARNNHVDCIQFLLANGADPSIVSKKGATALSLAQKFGSPEAIAALKKAP